MKATKNTYLGALAVMLFSVTGTANAALIEVFQDGSIIDSLADADALIATTSPIATDNIFQIDYNDGGDGNGDHYFNIGIDNPWPGGVVTDFVALITGTFTGPAGFLADFRVSHDDGVRLIVNGFMVEYSPPTDDRDTFLTNIVLQAVNTLEIVFYERGGGASLEFAARCSYDQGDACNNTNFFHLGVDDPVAVPEPGTLALIGIGLFGMGLARRRKKI